MSEPKAGNPMADDLIAQQAREAADAIGVTPHSDMRLFVEQAVKYALARISRAPIPADAVAWQRRFRETGNDGEWLGWELIGKRLFDEHQADPHPSREVRALYTGAAEDDETYEIGKRDGYEEAVQDIDLRTGGDGEYRYCTDHDPDWHTPTPEAMIERIVDRFNSRVEGAGDTEPGDLVGPVAWRWRRNMSEWYLTEYEPASVRPLNVDVEELFPASALAAEKQRATDERQAGWSALRMIRDAVGEMFGPTASIESEEAVLLRGSDYHHEAQAIIAALQNVEAAHREVTLLWQEWQASAIAEMQQVIELEGALTPFAEAAHNYAECSNDSEAIDNDATVTVGNLRDARAALRPAETGGPE